MRPFVSCFAIFIFLLCPALSYSGALENRDSLDMIYGDQSHCLTLLEIRGAKDNPISCYCRDSLVDAQYLFTNYFNEKDYNLSGAVLTLEAKASEVCGEGYDVHKVTQDKNWKWNGPQVTREYPTNSEINKIQPDRKGFRTVKVKVRLTYLNLKGQVVKIENYTVVDKVPVK